MNASEKELFLKLGREAGVKEEALDGVARVHQALADIGIHGTMRDEATVRESFRRFKDKLNSMDWSEGFDIELLGVGLIVQELRKGGDLDGKGIGIQGFGRVQGSC